MGFLSPVWLWLLVPWIAAMAAVLRAGTTPAAVPFLGFWPRAGGRGGSRRSIRRPPIWVVLLLASSLLGILAGAGPFVGSSEVGPVHVIVDRGERMSRLLDGSPRLAWALQDAVDRGLLPADGRGMRWTAIPPLTEPIPDDTTPAAALQLLRPTAIDTRGIPEMLARPGARGTRVLLGDLPGDRLADGVSVVSPPPVDDPGRIVRFSATVSPRVAQAMVEWVVSGSRTLVVLADGAEIAREPVAGSDLRFLDIPQAARTLQARLDPPDAAPASDAAFLARAPSTGGIAFLGEISEPLRRVGDAYLSARPTDPAGPTIVIGRRGGSDDGIAPGILLPALSEPVVPLDANAAVIAADPRVSGIDWESAGQGAAVRGAPPDGFVSLVRYGTVVAVAAEPGGGGLWVGLESEGWERSIDYPIFWTRALDGLTSGTSQFVALPLQRFPSNWTAAATPTAPGNVEPGLWPGVWADPQGRPTAVSADGQAIALPPAPPNATTPAVALPPAGIGRSGFAAGALLLALLGVLAARSQS